MSKIKTNGEGLTPKDIEAREARLAMLDSTNVTLEEYWRGKRLSERLKGRRSVTSAARHQAAKG